MKKEKVKAKVKEAHIPWHNPKAIENVPSEIDCVKCKKTGWVDEVKCDNCDGYGFLNITLAQRISLAFGDCYLDKEKGTLTYYV